jgi:DNA-binding NtrC family response regulator
LYYRLNVINIHMPPLRERTDDIPLLVHHFLTKRRPAGQAPRITEAAMEALLGYDWPGNVRQLENTIERAVVMAQSRLISPEHLLLTDPPPTSDQGLSAGLERLLNAGGTLETILGDLRQRLVALVLDRHQGDQAAAARALGVEERDLDGARRRVT